MRRGVCFFLLGFAGCLAASVQDFAGRWTDEGFGSYGGEFVVCVDAAAGTAQGFYSEVGYVRGSVMEVAGVATWSGFWYEAGQYGYGDNWGAFVLQLSDDAESFNGTWTLASTPGENYVWANDRISRDVPSKDECWAAEFSTSAVSSERTAAAMDMSLHGTWEEEDETPKWWVCISGNTFTSSYKYYVDGVLEAGYITGDVVQGGRVLMGHWYEKDFRGIYLMVAGSDSLMRATWWEAADLDGVDIANVDNEDMHGFDFSVRRSYNAEPEECNQFACIAGGCHDKDDDDDNNSETAVIVALAICVGVSGLAMLSMFGFLWRAGVIGKTHKHKRRGSNTNVQDVQLKDTA